MIKDKYIKVLNSPKAMSHYPQNKEGKLTYCGCWNKPTMTSNQHFINKCMKKGVSSIHIEENSDKNEHGQIRHEDRFISKTATTQSLDKQQQRSMPYSFTDSHRSKKGLDDNFT